MREKQNVKDIINIYIFNNLITDTNKYLAIFSDPFNADNNTIDKNLQRTQCHYLRAFFIYNNRISPSNKLIIKDNIDCFYFVYVDYGMDRWDDKYWFCIGKTKDECFFSYESKCCGTGFGLGSQTKIYYSRNQNILLTYGIEDKHRTFIQEHKKMFLCIENKLD